MMSEEWQNPLEAKEETPKVEVEVTPPKAPKQEDDSSDAVSERVQKRINQLTRRWKTEADARTKEMQLYEAERNDLKKQLQEARKSTVEAISTGADNYEKQLQDKLKLSKQQFENAYDTGDKSSLSEAQLAISEATAELKLLQITRAKQPKMEERGEVRPQQAPPPRQAQYHPKAVAWADKNKSWFGQDQIATASALAVDQALQQEGWDPTSDEYYEEVGERMKKRFPEYFEDKGEEPEVQKKQVRSVVQGGSRSPGGVQKVKLSENELRKAKLFGLTPEQFAAQKLKTDAAAGDYTQIL